MCYWLIPKSGKPIAETTVQHVTLEDMRHPDIKAQVDVFNDQLAARLTDANFTIKDDFYVEDFYDEFDDNGNNLTNYGDSGINFYSHNSQNDPAYGDKENTPLDSEYEMSREKENIEDLESLDKYIGAKMVLDQANPGNLATVRRRATDINGKPIGSAHPNPMLDSREYEVELEDGTTDKYFANIIAENLWSQCDEEGREFLLLRGITNHRKNNRAISKDDGFIFKPNGSKLKKKTIRRLAAPC